jgi:hypothetical protein
MPGLALAYEVAQEMPVQSENRPNQDLGLAVFSILCNSTLGSQGP